MTPREQLIQEVLLAPDSLVNLLLQLIRSLRAGQTHLLQKLQQLVAIAAIHDTESSLDPSEHISGMTLEQLYGICADDPIGIDEAGIAEGLDEDMVGVFE